MPNLPVQSWQNGGSKSKGSACDATKMAIYPSIITIQMLDVVNPSGIGNINNKVLPYLNKYANCFQMTNHREIAHFLSQIAGESKFTVNVEDTRYTLSRAREVWHIKKTKPFLYNEAWVKKVCNKPIERVDPKTKKIIHDFKCDGKALFNDIYKNINGNKKRNDGSDFIGRGIIQITGRDIYQSVTDSYQKRFDKNTDFIKHPELLNHYEYSVPSAFIYWRDVARHLQEIASADHSTVSAVTKVVNHGCNGYSDRLDAFKKIAKYLNLEIPDESHTPCWEQTHKKTKK